MAEVKNWIVLDKNNIITNIIAATDEYAEQYSLNIMYDGAEIGAAYNPPEEETEIAAITQTQIALAELAEAEAAHDLENKLALAELAEALTGE